MFTSIRLLRSNHSFEFWTLTRCLIWFMCVPFATAQQYYGGLTGTITDSSGAVLTGVSVKLTNLSKGTVTGVVSNEVGIFRAANLLPDTYKIEAELAGFKKFSRQPLLVEANRTLTLDIRMEVGEITETVDVSDAPPILETESATTTNTIEGSLVTRLPVAVASRNDLKSTVAKLPGSVSGNQVSINGDRGAQTSWDVDGLPNRGPNGGGMMEEHSINYESVKSWKYTLVNANAESPSPSQISLLTRSGSNDSQAPCTGTPITRSSTPHRTLCQKDFKSPSVGIIGRACT